MIHTPSSTKNKIGKYDPETHQTKKGNQYYFAAKAHTGADVESGRVHSVVVTAANVAEVIWQIAARRSTYKKHGERSALYKSIRKIEKARTQVRAKVEPPFWVIKRQSGYEKKRFRGLAKNTAHMLTLFALSSLRTACRHRHLLAGAGEVRA